MTEPADIFEQAKPFLPKYLTPEQTKDLYSELSRFPAVKGFYLSGTTSDAQLLQGDGWRGFVAINFHTGDRKTISGVILSNSCDISAENERYHPVHVLFAPLIDLQRFAARLSSTGKTPEQVETILTSIRQQRVTSMFYLPSGPEPLEESIILLDDIHAHPLEHFMTQERQSLFTLSQHAFYIFLIKLSIHFCRFNEKVQRFNPILGS